MQSFFNKIGIALVLVLNFLAETVVVAIVAVAVAIAVVGVLNVEAAPIEHTTINRAQVEEEQQDSGDSELPLVRLASTIDRLTGWSNLSPNEQAVRVKCAGLVLETIGKSVPKSEFMGAFTHSFLRQMGCQMQVAAMQHLDEISPNPAIAFCQGILVGL